jgi:hypothetical protein
MLYVLTFGGDPVTMESLPTAEARRAQAELDAWWGGQWRAGRLIAGAKLMAPFSATTVRFDGSRSLVLDGPFTLEADAIGGFGIIQAVDLDEALAVARTWPLSGYVEIRPLAGAADTTEPGGYPQPVAQRGQAE